MIYLDAAYLAKFYLAEPDSQRVRNAILTAPASSSCLHGRLETVSVFHRKLREGTVTPGEFAAHCRIGLLGVAAVERELSALFGRTVDLRTPADLSPHFRDDVCRTAALQYAA